MSALQVPGTACRRIVGVRCPADTASPGPDRRRRFMDSSPARPRAGWSSPEVPDDPAQRGDGLQVAALVVLGGPGAALDDDDAGGRVDEEVLAVHADAGERPVAERPPLVGVPVVVVAARAEGADGEPGENAAAAAPDPGARHHLLAGDHAGVGHQLAEARDVAGGRVERAGTDRRARAGAGE